MTRQDVEREHTIAHGHVVSKGKFEGEPVWAPYFWQLALDGAADWESEDLDKYQFAVTQDHKAIWPELSRAKTVFIAEMDDGDIVTTTTE